MRATSRNVVSLLLLGLAGAGAALLFAYSPHVQPRPVQVVFPEAPTNCPPAVEVLSCATIEEAVFFKVMGVVRSATREPVKYVLACAEFLDDHGHVVDQSRTLASPEVLFPDYRSRFVLVTRPDSRIRRVRVSFVDEHGRAVPADVACREPAQGFVEP